MLIIKTVLGISLQTLFLIALLLLPAGTKQQAICQRLNFVRHLT
jgi:hypothetical protein